MRDYIRYDDEIDAEIARLHRWQAVLIAWTIAVSIATGIVVTVCATTLPK